MNKPKQKPDMYCDFVAKLSRSQRLCLGAEQSGTLLVAGFDQLGLVVEQMRQYGGLSASMGHIALTLFGFHEDSTTTGEFEDACVYYHGTNSQKEQQFLNSMTLYGFLRSQHATHLDWSLTDFLFKTPKQIWPWLFKIGNASSIRLCNESYGTLVECTFEKTAWDGFVKRNAAGIADFVSRQAPAKEPKSWRSLMKVRVQAAQDQGLLDAFLKAMDSQLIDIKKSINYKFVDNYGPVDDYLMPLFVALSKTLLAGICNGSGGWEHCKYFAFSALPVFKHDQIEKSCAGLFLTSDGCESPSETIEKMISMTHFISSYWTYHAYRTVAVSMALRHATRAAAAAIFSRNWAHHIGSHVMPRATVKDVEKRLAELYLIRDEPPQASEVFPSVERLKTMLDDFIQKKADFLAEVTTDPCASSDTRLLGRDVLAPLMRNALLMDNIARNEGYGYELAPKEELSSEEQLRLSKQSDMKLRRKMEVELRMRSTLKVSFCVRANGDCRRLLGHELPPYDPSFWPLDSQNREPSLFGVVPDCADRDPMIAVPGMVGQYALYGILENIIRNAAKHDKSEKKAPILHIHLHVEDDPDAPDDYCLLSIWDDRANPASATITSRIPNQPGVEQKERRIAEHLQAWADADLIDPSGAVRRDAWGIAEIVICANLLAGRSRYDNRMLIGDKERKVVRVYCGPSPHVEGKALSCNGRDISHDECQGQRLIHQLRLLKAKRAAFIGRAFSTAWAGEADDALRKKGIYTFSDTDALKRFLRRPEARQAFQFAVFDGDSVPATVLDRSDDANTVFLAKLPFRLFWITASGTEMASGSGRSEVVSLPLDRLADLVASPTADGLMELLWQNWIAHSKRLNPEGKAVTSLVYLDVESGDPTFQKWAKAADEFNSHNGPVRVSPRSGASKQAHDDASDQTIRAAFVRHKDTLGPLSAEDMFESFGKRSVDCDALLGAVLPTESEPYWELPYLLAEAGLVRILVIDERMTERALAPYDGDSRIRERLQAGSPKSPCFWHLAQRAKVYIATHLQVGDEATSMRPLHRSYDTAKQTRGEIKSADASLSCPALKIKVTENGGLETDLYDPDCAASATPKPEFDIVVIHQGVIDSFRPKGEKGESKVTEDEMRKWLAKDHPWLVIESGRGIPPGLQKQPVRFLSFSVLDQALTEDGIGKLYLTRRLMALPRFVDEGGEA